MGKNWLRRLFGYWSAEDCGREYAVDHSLPVHGEGQGKGSIEPVGGLPVAGPPRFFPYNPGALLRGDRETEARRVFQRAINRIIDEANDLDEARRWAALALREAGV